MAKSTTTPAVTDEAKAEALPTPCACSFHEVEIWTGEVPEDGDPNDYVKTDGTGCLRTTTRTFAPGHDAILKSMLIKAGAAGLGVRTVVGGMLVVSDAQSVADRYGFGHMVSDGIQRARIRAAEKAEKKAATEAARSLRALAAETEKAARAERKKATAEAKQAAAAERKSAADQRAAEKAATRAAREAAQPKTVQARIKVGRWEYDAVINTADNTATFTSAGGAVVTVADEKWSLVTV